MNVVLDVLRLRRVKLDYISPPICQVILSGSGSSLMLEAVTSPEPPANLAFSGQCDRFLTWTNPENAACVTLYKAVNPNDPVTQYVPVTDCVPVGFASVCTPGWWKYRTFTEDGEVSDYSAPIFAPGGTPVAFQIVQIQDAVRYELYKNHNPTDPNAVYRLVMSGTNFHVIEVCEASGCYRAQVITDDGPSSLSNPICRTSVADCCPSPGCPIKYNWNGVWCSCVPGDLISDVYGPLPNGCAGVAYSSALTVIGGQSPFLWELLAGNVPPGLNLHTGLFTGTTAPIDGTPSASGSYSFTIRCTSIDQSSIEKTFSINVVGITQGSLLPSGITDTPYSEQLVGQGGIAPYSFTLESGVLPTGLSLSASGLISGTPLVSDSQNIVLGVTDSEGISCDVPEVIQVTGCPNVTTWPTVAITGEPANVVTEIALDRQRRRLWIPQGGYQAGGPPYQYVRVVDTSAISYLGLATDPSNFINTAAKGDTYRFALIDTKYDQFITGGGQGWFSFYDLETQQCLGVSQMIFGTQVPQENTAYDSLRGYIYRESPTIGGFLQMVTFDCNPAVRAVIASTGNTGGFTSSSIAYSPGADMVYLANSGGNSMFHKWNPVSGLYTTNAGPVVVGATFSQVRWIRELDLLLFNGSNGHCYIIDPNNADALVADITFGGGFAISGSIDYNDCTGVVYTCSETQNSQIQVLDPSNGWSRSTLAGVGVNEFYAFQFDQYSNRLFTHDRGTSTVKTY